MFLADSLKLKEHKELITLVPVERYEQISLQTTKGIFYTAHLDTGTDLKGQRKERTMSSSSVSNCLAMHASGAHPALISLCCLNAYILRHWLLLFKLIYFVL